VSFGGTTAPFSDSVHPDDRLVLGAEWPNLNSGAIAGDHTLRLIMPDGRMKWVIARMSPNFYHEGRAVRAIGTTQDITERVKLEEGLRQAHKMEAIGRLTGGIAHDFNNILTVIQTNLEQLEVFVPDSLAQACFERIRAASNRAAGLTGRLRAYSRQSPLTLYALDVGKELREIVPILRSSLPETVNINCEIEVEGLIAKVDSAEIMNALLNLAINACDAMPNGETLSLKAGTRDLQVPLPCLGGDIPPGRYVHL
jgi:signal transduction histidine kinase